MLLTAAALMAISPCTPSIIAAAATVSQPQHVRFSTVGLSRVDVSFQAPIVQDVAWTGACAPEIVGLYGGRTFVTNDNLLLWAMESRVEVRAIKMLAADPEPSHPTWKSHRFEGSASLMAGTWRVGMWVQPNGTAVLARYRTDSPAKPVLLLTTTQPFVGIFYLGAPDSVGGTLFFAQRLGHSRFRMVSMGWSEKGLRNPVR